MGRTKSHPEWLHRECGGAVKREAGGPALKTSEKTRPELDEDIANDKPGLGNPKALGLGAGVGTMGHFLLRSKMAAPLRGLATAAGAEITRRMGNGLYDDMGDAMKAIDARGELRKRAKADADAGGYKSGGIAKPKRKAK